MKKFFISMVLLIPVYCFSEGPILKQNDPMKATNVQQEFENVYQDLRSLHKSTVTFQSVTTQTLSASNAVISTASFQVYTATKQPCFLAVNSILRADVTGDGTGATAEFDTEIFDNSSSFFGSSFTAPIAGRYLFSASVAIKDGTSSFSDYTIQLITTQATYQSKYKYQISGDNHTIGLVPIIVPMSVGDKAYVNFVVSGPTKTIDQTSGTSLNYFSGCLLN